MSRPPWSPHWSLVGPSGSQLPRAQRLGSMFWVSTNSRPHLAVPDVPGLVVDVVHDHRGVVPVVEVVESGLGQMGQQVVGAVGHEGIVALGAEVLAAEQADGGHGRRGGSCPAGSENWAAVITLADGVEEFPARVHGGFGRLSARPVCALFRAMICQPRTEVSPSSPG